MTLLEGCIERLAGGGAVVAANNRLARHLRAAYAHAQERQGRTAWPTPDVLPWDVWLVRLWDAVAWRSEEPVPVPLDETREQELWQSVIVSSGDGLLDIPAAARTARDAHRRLCGWRIPIAELRRHPGEETRAFLRWHAIVAQRCAREGWIEAARLPDDLASRLTQLGAALPPSVTLVGFDELDPQQRAFLEALEQAGSRVETPVPSDLNRAVRRLELPDARAEAETAARWARCLLARGDPGRIGVVIPDLAARREEIRRVFTDVLAPEAAVRSSMQDRLPFSISAGRALRDYAPVHAAFLILDLARGALPFEAFGQLLRSPWIRGAEEEDGPRARLDARLRERQWLEVSIDRALREAKAEYKPCACPRLERSLQELARVGGNLGGRRLPGDWLATLDAALKALGWPGERSLSSHDFQTVEAFRKLQRKLYTLGSVTGEVSYEQAAALLDRIAGAAMFQPETPPAAVEILGTLEAAGHEFDHLWIAGLHDEFWPPPARPNGFVPAALQRACGMPHASADRELEYAAAVTARLISSATNVVISSPRQEQDRPLRPSPLIRRYRAIDEAELEIDRGRLLAEALFDARGFERLAHDPAPPLAATESARGGTSLLRHQAACGFRAFAELRLHARPLESPAPGIDARERGKLLHEALQGLWSELGTQAALLSFDGPARDVVIRRHVEAAAQRLRRHPARLVELEIERAGRLIAELLRIESLRAPFVVESREEAKSANIGGLTLTTRADRIDRLPDGATLIIDYKTGKANVTGWWGDRPDEPQLPLYAINADTPAAGVSFAILRSDSVCYSGLARAGGIGPGISAFADWRARPSEIADWDAALVRWRETLERLAGDFRAGRAEVDPKHPVATCRLCHLGLVCRIAESARTGEDDEDAG
ncbi:MAG: PD-(D/E)XK nuclease family protein [Gammaproteobacteria bacterium]